MTPLVRRRARNAGSFPLAAARPAVTLDEAAGWVEDAKLFAAGWVGGLVVVGTLFG